MIHVFAGRTYRGVLEYSRPHTESRRTMPTQLMYIQGIHGTRRCTGEIYSPFQAYTGARIWLCLLASLFARHEYAYVHAWTPRGGAGRRQLS
jgi:hypothetical protein